MTMTQGGNRDRRPDAVDNVRRTERSRQGVELSTNRHNNSVHNLVRFTLPQRGGFDDDRAGGATRRSPRCWARSRPRAVGNLRIALATSVSSRRRPSVDGLNPQPKAAPLFLLQEQRRFLTQYWKKAFRCLRQ
jgi:hypothetical protein